LRVLSALQTGQNPGAVSSLLKLRVSEIRQAVTRLGVEVIAMTGSMSSRCGRSTS
jgi:acyl-CoA dehydrogenase